MGRPKKDLTERVLEFQKDGLYVADTNIVMCKYCNIRLDGDKKDTLKKHVKAETHLKKFSMPCATVNKRQSTIAEIFEKQKRVKDESKTFIEDTVNMCLRANIPLHKMDHPAVREYFDKYVPGSGVLPVGDTLRRKFLPLCGQSEKDSVKNKLKNTPIVVMADETSDKQGRCVFAILFKTIDDNVTQECFLASVNFLDTANASTCSQSIIDTLKDYEIDYSKVKGMVSDSARYMSACFDLLKILIGDHILHYQCWAHKINLVGDVFVGEFKELNMVVAKVKSAFLLSRKMKSSFLKYLNEHVPFLPAKLYPTPIVTRWNSWFKAVLYLYEYLDYILAFFDELENPNSSVLLLMECCSEPNFNQKLKIQMTFISEFCPRIMKLIDNLEGTSYPIAHLLWDKLEDLKSSLERQCQGYFDEKTALCLKEHEGIDETMKSMLKSSSDKSFRKLSNHMKLNKTNEVFYHIGQLFSPSVAASSTTLNISVLVTSFLKIPFFQGLPQNELIDGYTHFHKLILRSININENPSVKDILLAVKCNFPSFAKAALQCIWSPTNSVDAERFFSIYNILVTDRRTKLKESSIEISTMLSFN